MSPGLASSALPSYQSPRTFPHHRCSFFWELLGWGEAPTWPVPFAFRGVPQPTPSWPWHGPTLPRALADSIWFCSSEVRPAQSSNEPQNAGCVTVNQGHPKLDPQWKVHTHTAGLHVSLQPTSGHDVPKTSVYCLDLLHPPVSPPGVSSWAAVTE